jgi:hypothetical protein
VVAILKSNNLVRLLQSLRLRRLRAAIPTKPLRTGLRPRRQPLRLRADQSCHHELRQVSRQAVRSRWHPSQQSRTWAPSTPRSRSPAAQLRNIGATSVGNTRWAASARPVRFVRRLRWRRRSSVVCRAVTTDLSAGTIALTHDELRERMIGNLCRCRAYNGIVDAITEVYAEVAE